MSVRELGERAKIAARALARTRARDKNLALQGVAAALEAGADDIARENARDVEAARSTGTSGALLDRLTLTAERVAQVAQAVRHIATLPDPVGSRGPAQRLENGLLIARQRVPLGVIAMIYEARPNVTVDAACLCLKSGNAVLLRGGREAQHSNRALGQVMREALAAAGLNRDAVQIVPPGDRDEIRDLLSLTDLVDLAIPRGGEGLIRFVAEVARVPVIKHYQGVCHLFLDAGADAEMAERLTLNAKVQRPGVCNALECLLVHAAEAARLLPPIAAALMAQGVELRGCERTREHVPAAKAVRDEDFGAEFLDKILAIRVVDDLDQALAHIERFGSNHTEAICTPHELSARRWVDEVDASCVVVNASTRFNDGGELGLGAEIGISTSKLHAYGPMGLESLTTEKWVVLGEGQVRG